MTFCTRDVLHTGRVAHVMADNLLPHAPGDVRWENSSWKENEGKVIACSLRRKAIFIYFYTSQSVKPFMKMCYFIIRVPLLIVPSLITAPRIFVKNCCCTQQACKSDTFYFLKWYSFKKHFLNESTTVLILDPNQLQDCLAKSSL